MSQNNHKIRIRPAIKKDLAALTKLCEQLGYPASQEDIAKRLDELLNDADHTLLVALTSQDKVVGFVHGFIRRLLIANRHIEIGGLVVEEEYRHQGIGKQLIAACENWAVREGIMVVFLRSNIIRIDAHRFYQNQGYEFLKTSYTFVKQLTFS
jgi:GNAT superfamily N-acetyltransferase